MKSKTNSYEIILALKPPNNNTVIVTGLSRSGKSMIAPILASLQEFDDFNMDYIFDMLPVLKQLNLITDQIAIMLMRYLVTFKNYDNRIGRNINFRLSDWTSIWNRANPIEYFSRLSKEEGDTVYDEMDKSNFYNMYMCHNALHQSEIYFKAFPDLKMLHINRHPVDIVTSWYKRGYGSLDFYSKNRSAMPCILYKNQQIPYHAIGWENKFISLTEMNRVVKMVYNLVEKDSFAYHSLSKRLKDQIILVNFDEFVTHSDFYLNTICEFFNTTLTDHTNIVLDRESCPRSIDYNGRKSNLIMINNLSNIQSVDMVSEMIENYEK